VNDSRGFVSLIGAGPGDPGLLTLAGAEALAAADVVVYDYLANPALLAHAQPEAEQIYVGKRAGQHTLSQEEINALLVERALAGQRVARLKGGDPFVFGRGGEEALALVEAGLPFEVIPGVTSAVAAPAYAGIPVTHRGLSTSFAVITGHEDPTKEESAIDWPHLATAVDTLIFLMGVGNLPKIVDQLSAHSRPPETPVALVRWGTMPDQQTVSGTLADIVARVEAAGLRPPAVAVVGPVAGLRQQLRWFEDRPLFGQRVLVTRTREQASLLSARLRALGAEAIELPTIRIAPPADWRPSTGPLPPCQIMTGSSLPAPTAWPISGSGCSPLARMPVRCTASAWPPSARHGGRAGGLRPAGRGMCRTNTWPRRWPPAWEGAGPARAAAPGRHRPPGLGQLLREAVPR
jgi:uroporphyrinogen III methyltransferase / synthase